ncbi:MAG: Asd/ArgC dimerization domain-containing protein [Candidatus Solibacter sp.]
MPNSSTVALVGSETLLSREIRDIVATQATELSLRLVASVDEESGALTRLGDEPSVVNLLSAETLSEARAIILAGNLESSRRALELAGDPPDAAIIDLTFAAEERPDARLRAPQIETEFDEDPADIAVHVIAHPAAIALALFLRRLHTNDAIRSAVIQVFVPASEHGTVAVHELQQQTVSLLSFKGMPKAVFDAQLSFNMLPRYGEEAPVSLEESELRIERHLATLLALPGEGEGAPMPSLRVIQAPVFHGYSFSAWVEFENLPDIGALESSLSIDAIDVRGADLEPPTNVGQAGMGGIAVGAIAPDRNHPDAMWLWFVADNIRLAAENAVAVARQLV